MWPEPSSLSGTLRGKCDEFDSGAKIFSWSSPFLTLQPLPKQNASTNSQQGEQAQQLLSSGTKVSPKTAVPLTDAAVSTALTLVSGLAAVPKVSSLTQNMANPESEEDHERVTPILAADHIVASSSGSEAVSQDEEDDGQALLPRHTKVRVTGNNRTKQSLVGLTGVVKKAVGLGGWHWLVLSNGVECRLQRNALAVLEPPTGNETDFSDLDEDTATGYQTELLPRVRARRPPKPISFAPEGPQLQRKSARQLHPGGSRIDFNKLDTVALKRYRRFHQLDDVGANPTKEELVSAVGRHFNAQVVDENRAIAMFVHAAARKAAWAH